MSLNITGSFAALAGSLGHGAYGSTQRLAEKECPKDRGAPTADAPVPDESLPLAPQYEAVINSQVARVAGGGREAGVKRRKNNIETTKPYKLGYQNLQ